MKSLLVSIIFPISIFSQFDFINKLDTAYLYAKKGIYWGLENINFRKDKLDNQLLSGNSLIATIKIKKMIDGYQIESTGYYDTYSAKLSFFRSSDYLYKNGYLKNDSTSVIKSKNKRKKNND